MEITLIIACMVWLFSLERRAGNKLTEALSAKKNINETTRLYEDVILDSRIRSTAETVKELEIKHFKTSEKLEASILKLNYICEYVRALEREKFGFHQETTPVKGEE